MSPLCPPGILLALNEGDLFLGRRGAEINKLDKKDFMMDKKIL
jgi:hypothetical protein